MKNDDAEFLSRLLATFAEEADEHVNALSGAVVELESAGADETRRQISERLLREAHSLKGAARSVGLAAIELICQAMESVFAALKQGELTLEPRMFDLLHRALSELKGLSAEARAKRQPGEGAVQSARELEKAFGGLFASGTVEPMSPIAGDGHHSHGPAPHAAPASKPAQTPPQAPRDRAPAPPAEHPPAPESETVRISADKLDALFYHAEEMVSAKLSARQRILDLQELREQVSAWRKECGKLKASARGRNGGGSSSEKLVSLLDWNDEWLKSTESKLSRLIALSQQDSRSLSGMVDHVLEDAKKALMFPFSSVLETFPSLVREISRSEGKEARLSVQGENIEIDRRILQEIKDPLTHLVRNAIDHGIEKPEARAARGKPAAGTIRISVSRPESGKVEVKVSDDGGGVDSAALKKRSVEAGIVSESEAEKLSEGELTRLMFVSGVSTSKILTELSGRGVGLAIVKEKIQRLGGSISIESRQEEGTAFQMILPLTLATFRGILVSSGGGIFVFPSSGVERVLRIRIADIKTVENRETVPFMGETIQLVRLDQALEIRRTSAPPENGKFVTAVVAGSGEKRVAFGVDEILGDQEILVKNLGRQLARVRNVAAATVLGSGRVVPILNVDDLILSSARVSARPETPRAAAPTGASSGKKSILVAEDSITSRTLLKNILESAGYQVTTAADGAEALALAKAGAFDLVVSDVDMPRMSGLDLTARIRAEKKLEGLPVILVTALGTREDRERGIDAGANAYIVKSGFNQDNLLEIVERLI